MDPGGKSQFARDIRSSSAGPVDASPHPCPSMLASFRVTFPRLRGKAGMGVAPASGRGESRNTAEHVRG